jgi:hypothetical protein
VHDVRLVQSEFAPLAKGDKHVLFVEEAKDWRKYDLVLVREYDSDVDELTGKHRLGRVTWIDKSAGRMKRHLANGVMAASVRIFREPRSI